MLKTYNWEDIEKLKEEALSSSLLRSRILVHDSRQDQIQQMLIVLHRDSVIDMHRHPNFKTESYLLIEGEMRVNYWDSIEGKFWFKEYCFNKKSNFEFFGRHSGGIWHMPQVLTEWCVYLETYQGPFVKEIDVEYILTESSQV